jgi:hypothetical protein
MKLKKPRLRSLPDTTIKVGKEYKKLKKKVYRRK